MSGVLLSSITSAMPRLIGRTWSTTVVNTQLEFNNPSVGRFRRTESGVEVEDFLGWGPINDVPNIDALYEVMMTVEANNGTSWINSGVWDALSGVVAYSGSALIPSATCTLRFDIRLASTTAIVAVGRYFGTLDA